MKKTRSQSVLRNGAIQEKRLVHHKDGTVSIKKKIIQQAPVIHPVPISPIRKVEPAPEPKVTAKTTSAMKLERAMKRTVKPEDPVTNELRGKVTKIYEGLTPYSVRTTNKAPDILKRIKARYGSHVDSFQEDYEIAQGEIRSPNLEGVSGGGNGVALPLARIQAIDRIKEFEAAFPRSFYYCIAVLIYGATPSDLHKKVGVQTVVASQYIRDAVDDLANFYSPNKKRPDRYLTAIAKFIDEERRKAKI